jgi:hypothetical protein
VDAFGPVDELCDSEIQGHGTEHIRLFPADPFSATRNAIISRVASRAGTTSPGHTRAEFGKLTASTLG